MKICFLLFLQSFTAIVTFCSAASCPGFQLLHTVDGQSVCCKPVFNCPFGTQVRFCAVNGSQDTCEKCPNGTKNMLMSSSVDIHNCFNVTKSHKSCPVDDSEEVYENVQCPRFPCRCRWEACYHGEPCDGACSLSSNRCGINQEMNHKTGICEPCRTYMYKNESGCQPCLWNETEWRLSNGDQDHSRGSNVMQVFGSTHTMSEKKLVMESTNIAFHNNITSPSLTTVNITDQKNLNFVPIVIGIVVGIVIVLSIIVVCVMWKRKMSRKNTLTNNQECISVRELENTEEKVSTTQISTTQTNNHLTNGHTDAACSDNEETLVKEIDDDRPLMGNQDTARRQISIVKPTLRDPPQLSIAYYHMSMAPSNDTR